MRTRTALFLCLFAAAGMALLSLLSSLVAPGVRPWLSMLGSLLFFGVPAALGLFVLDGDHSRLLMRRNLSSAQTLWFFASGALMVCPSVMLSGMVEAVCRSFGAQATTAQAATSGAGFVPMLLASAVIAPLCEELFFRGYLLGAFSSLGRGRAALMAALLFAAVHGLGMETPVLVGMGLLFAAAMLFAQSLLAPLMMHMAYNMTLILLAYSGLGALLTGGNPFSGALLLLGCAGFSYTLQRAWRAQGEYAQEELPQKPVDIKKLWPLLLGVILALAAQVVALLTEVPV